MLALISAKCLIFMVKLDIRHCDYLPQFVIIPNMFRNISSSKYDIYEKEWSKFNQENFMHYFSVGWEDLLKIDELNA